MVHLIDWGEFGCCHDELRAARIEHGSGDTPTLGHSLHTQSGASERTLARPQGVTGLLAI